MFSSLIMLISQNQYNIPEFYISKTPIEKYTML